MQCILHCTVGRSWEWFLEDEGRQSKNRTLEGIEYDATLLDLAPGQGVVEGVQQPRQKGNGIPLNRELELLLAAQDHRLQHLVG